MKSSKVIIPCVLAVHLLNITYVTGVPGVKSIRRCNKYYDFKFSLRELDDYKPLTSNEIEEILDEERIEEPPQWSFGAVGGQNAYPKQYPFMVALGYGTETNKEYLCGATLISEEYVLTAAHCINSAQGGEVKYVRLGELILRNETDDDNVVEMKVSKYHIHPNYEYPLRYNDIALIKTEEPVKFTEYIQPACLEYERVSLKYVILYATGWGLLGYGEDASDHLQKVMLRLYTVKNCQKTYPVDALRLPNGFTDVHQMCVGTITNITDTCEGDSGGPLIYLSYEFGKPFYYLTGVTSFGVPCGLSELPAVYTRVSFYIHWIEGIVWPEK